MNVKKLYHSPRAWYVLVAGIVIISCAKQLTPAGESVLATSVAVPPSPLEVVKEDGNTARQRAKEIKESVSLTVADGLRVDLWASDSLAPDPIAMSIDDQGRVYLTRTNRQKNSEFDIRGHRDWMTPSIGLQSVEDRRAFLRETFAPAKSKENEWLKDLNEDGSHDWRDLAVEKDEVWRLEDTDKDGIADVSTRILSDFFEEVSDVAGALLVRAKDVFVGIAPDMWRLTDTNNDGILDQKTSISHGFGVHIGFGGHGMSGAIEGPDGRIYWGIGDIGANLVDVTGKKYSYPNEGVIVRSNPDGTDFEVFASGLRNTHEFVFDEYGNLISSDNDGDHPGESERLVHIVDGSDAGWRSNWQYGKYTDPKNNSYKVWMDEQMFKPRQPGQAAYFIPPIQNFHNGPTGMVYNPGTALGQAWKRKFFLVEFVGNPARSPIWSFGLKPKGASFVLDGEQKVLTGILPTGIRFGPDGALYVADWLNGWDTKNTGRVWRLDVTGDKDDMRVLRQETLRLMQLDYAAQNDNALLGYLSNPDMRIRQKAQLQLAKRGARGVAIFEKALAQKDNQLARIHAVWGLGQMAREKESYGIPLLDYVRDADPEIVAQTAKVLGDAGIAAVGPLLVPMLTSSNPRVQFFGAQALGRVGYKASVPALLKMIETNKDEDLYLRHAAVVALARLNQVEPIVALADSPDKSLRLAAVLVLRRWGNENVRLFLNDKDEYIVAEAARAINDDMSIPNALPALAATLSETRFTSEPLLRRAINASLRVGGEAQLQALLDFAKRKDVSKELRTEALAALSTWANPSVLDRVDGRYRGVVKRDPAAARAKIEPTIAVLLQDKEPEVIVATADMMSSLDITAYNPKLVEILKDSKSPDVRAAMLTALSTLKYSTMEPIIKQGMNDADENVRARALSLVDGSTLSNAALADVVNVVFEKGSVKEQQQMLRTLSTLPATKTEPILDRLVTRMENKELSPNINLELTEAVDSTKSERLRSRLASSQPKGEGVASYMDALMGGDRQQGARYFYTNSTGQCARCHAINGRGGEVGPSLTKIGGTLSREQLLQALIEPSARLAPGYGTVMLTLKDGQSVSGILMEETPDQLVLKTSEAEPLKVPVARIAKRENVPSSMPPMGYIMSKREIRDVMEFLANLK
jgi:quinoprotein glucose dehydrogenase